MASHNYFKWQKTNIFNNIKLVNWIKYKLDPVFENHLWQTQAKIQIWLVTSLPIYPQNFLVGFRRFTKITLWGVGGTVPPSPPRGAAPATVAFSEKMEQNKQSLSTCHEKATVGLYFVILYGTINTYSVMSYCKFSDACSKPQSGNNCGKTPYPRTQIDESESWPRSKGVARGAQGGWDVPEMCLKCIILVPL